MTAAIAKGFEIETHRATTDAALPWLKNTAALAGDNAPDWMRALRSTGADVFATTGLPTTQWENWKYTNLRPLAADIYTYSADPVKFDAAQLPAPLFADNYRLVVVNGQFQKNLSTLPSGAEVLSLMDAAAQKMPGLEDHIVSIGDLAETPMKALNTAYVRDGFVLKVPKNGDLDKTVEVLFYTIGRAAAEAPAVYPRVLYWFGVHARGTIIERHMGEGAYFANIVSSVVVGAEASAKLYRFVEGSPDAVYMHHTTLRQERKSQFEGFCSVVGTPLARQEFRMQLIDSGIESTLGGIYLLKDQQHHDFTVCADHFEPDGKSVQHFKGVIDDQARAVFQGKIHVHRPAQKTDGYQSHHALLLSSRAEANTKPELEIYADDVKCTHGATSGFMDPEALFYLQSRGIPKDAARALLIQSFLNEGIERITNDDVKEVFRQQAEEWLEARGK